MKKRTLTADGQFADEKLLGCNTESAHWVSCSIKSKARAIAR